MIRAIDNYYSHHRGDLIRLEVICDEIGRQFQKSAAIHMNRNVKYIVPFELKINAVGEINS